jgi:hypothetical protein
VISSQLSGRSENFITPAILLLTFNGLDAVLSYDMARKDKCWPTRTQALEIQFLFDFTSVA